MARKEPIPGHISERERMFFPNGIRGEMLALRDEWINEVPSVIVTSISANPFYKVRKGWFANVIMATTIAYNYLGKITNEDLIHEAEEFTREYSSQSFNSRLTNAGDIERGNILLTHFINEIPSP